MSVITSGGIPFNPTELLGSERMDAFLQGVKNIADVIVIDTPPFVVADAQVLSAKADGVVMIIKPGHTRLGGALMMLEQLRESGAKILGAIMNNLTRNFSDDYGGYYYYKSYKRGYRYYSGDILPGNENTSRKPNKVPESAKNE
jgi:Mrp family chromosome partitioning ATPase